MWKKSALAALCAVALGGLAGCERPDDYGRRDDDLREYPEKPGPMTGDEATGAGERYDRPAGVGVPGQAPMDQPTQPGTQPMYPGTEGTAPMYDDPNVDIDRPSEEIRETETDIRGTVDEGEREMRESDREIREDVDDTMAPGTRDIDDPSTY